MKGKEEKKMDDEKKNIDEDDDETIKRELKNDPRNRQYYEAILAQMPPELVERLKNMAVRRR